MGLLPMLQHSLHRVSSWVSLTCCLPSSKAGVHISVTMQEGCMLVCMHVKSVCATAKETFVATCALPT